MKLIELSGLAMRSFPKLEYPEDGMVATPRMSYLRWTTSFGTTNTIQELTTVNDEQFCGPL